MAIFKVNAELRDDLGKGASRRLRRENKIPGIIYGSGRDPRAVSVEHHKVLKFIEDEAFFTSILELSADGGKRQKVILRDMQRHPSKPIIMHMDFQRISDKEVLHMNIPLHFLNEDESPAAKTAGIIIAHQITEVEVACLPADLPEFIEIDIAEFKEGDLVRLSDLKLPKGVVLTAFSHGDEADHDEVVISTTHVVAIATEETEEVAEATEEVTEEKTED
jgi:large subunit ribosomal protein L25